MPHIFSSVHHSVVSSSLRPHGLQCARLPCPSSTYRVYSNMSVESVMPSNHLILCHSLFLPPRVRVFPNVPHILHRKKRKEKYSCWKTSRLITRQKRIEKSQEWWAQQLYWSSKGKHVLLTMKDQGRKTEFQNILF